MVLRHEYCVFCFLQALVQIHEKEAHMHSIYRGPMKMIGEHSGPGQPLCWSNDMTGGSAIEPRFTSIHVVYMFQH